MLHLQQKDVCCIRLSNFCNLQKKGCRQQAKRGIQQTNTPFR